ncbi:hypothetical protein NUM3379_42270 [Kineococcus sp. NUM-3379]
MSATRERRRRGAVVAAVPLGLLASGILVYQSSQAAFTAADTATGNTWSAGTVTLNEGSTGTFTAGNLAPGSTGTGTRCFTVTYGGTVNDVDLVMYATGLTHTGGPDDGSSDLEDQLEFTVDAKYGDHATEATSVCENTFGAATTATTDLQSVGSATETATVFAATRNAYANGIRVADYGTANGNANRHVVTYRISYAFPNDGAQVDNLAQGDSFSLDLKWEVKNNV